MSPQSAQIPRKRFPERLLLRYICVYICMCTLFFFTSFHHPRSLISLTSGSPNMESSHRPSLLSSIFHHLNPLSPVTAHAPVIVHPSHPPESKMSLLNVPEELLCSVLEHVPDTDLVNVSQTSRRLRRIAYPRAEAYRALQRRYRTYAVQPGFEVGRLLQACTEDAVSVHAKHLKVPGLVPEHWHALRDWRDQR